MSADALRFSVLKGSVGFVGVFKRALKGVFKRVSSASARRGR